MQKGRKSNCCPVPESQAQRRADMKNSFFTHLPPIYSHVVHVFNNICQKNHQKNVFIWFYDQNPAMSSSCKTNGHMYISLKQPTSFFLAFSWLFWQDSVETWQEMGRERGDDMQQRAVSDLNPGPLWRGIHEAHAIGGGQNHLVSINNIKPPTHQSIFILKWWARGTELKNSCRKDAAGVERFSYYSTNTQIYNFTHWCGWNWIIDAWWAA